MAFVERQYRRYRTQLSVSYMGTREGRGTVENLSLGGCQVQGTTPVFQGDSLILTLQLPPYERSLRVDSAAVRWVSNQKFGLVFMWLDAVEHARLLQYLEALLQV
jgi:PilZ domain